MTMLGLGLPIVSSASPSWWPAGARFAVDFLGNRAMRSGVAVELASAWAISRASTGYGDTIAGDWVGFSANQPRLTDRGLRLEDAATDLTLNSASLDNWVTLNVSKAVDPSGPYLGLFTQPQVVADSVGSTFSRARSSNGGSTVASGATYTATFWIKAGSSGKALLAASGNAGTSYLRLDLPGMTVSASSSSRGPMTVVSSRAIGSVCEVVVSWVPNFSGGGDLGIGPGSGVSGHTVVAIGARLEAGSVATSPGIGSGATYTRAADALTLSLPDGSLDLTFTFDDLSTQTLTGCTGSYAVPTTLNRAVITRVVGV